MSASPPGFVLAPLNPRAGDVPAVGREREPGPSVVPSDSAYGSLWGMDKIQGPLAWDRTTGGTGLLVSDIDSGIDYTHPDLYLNVWLNQGEIPDGIETGLVESPTDGDSLITFSDLNVRDAGGSLVNASFVQDFNGNGRIDAGDLLNDSSGWEDNVDNDGNVSNGRAYVDDLVGWNFTNGTNDPFDGGTANQGHGTHTAGTIGAIGNNGIGVTGVNWTSQMMSLKIFGDDGSGIVDTKIADAIYYSADNGAKVSNNSWGGTGGTTGDALYTAINYAGSKNQLFVAAAGNGDFFGRGIDNDTSSSRVYPASYDLPNIIAVAATDSNDALASFSNYGATTVDLAAPGTAVLSTVPPLADSDGVKDGYFSHSGTSMATPHVAGVAALAWNLLGSGTSYSTVRNAVFSGVDLVSSLADKTVTGGRLNAANTLQQATPVAPSAPTSLAATAVSSSRIDLTWTDTSTNENGFRIERAPVTTSSDGTLLPLSFAEVARVAANHTAYSDTGLAANTTYTYRVVAFNSHPDEGVSNEARATTMDANTVTAPSGLDAVAGSSSQINLSWQDNSDNEGGFVVERHDGTAFVEIGRVGAGVTTYTDSGLTASTAYSYQVRALHADQTTVTAPSNVDTEMTAGTGTGLTGRYYADSTFKRLKATRTDAAVNFNWGNGRPMPGMPSDNFTVRWVAQVQPTKTEGYTFYAKVDDNVRLWINGELVLRRWGSANTSEYKTATPIQLEAGKTYNIQMDFLEMSGGASAYLKWASPSVPKQIIPQSQLYNTFSGAIATDSGTTTIGIDNGNGSSTTLAAPAPTGAGRAGGPLFSSSNIIRDDAGGDDEVDALLA